ncbi:MAG: MBL fold metallo-hydrolase [Clostridia bacterium]|nr:MBL fold metallo-hydrolase [Clostridia bacterium]
MKISYLGTTMLLFDDGKDQLLFDCHVTRPSFIKCLLGKFETDISVSESVITDCKINRLRGIFISHSHHDHVMDAPFFALRCNAHIYGSESSLNVARGGNVEEEKIHSFEECREFSIGDFRIKVLDSIHSVPHWYNNNIGKTIDEPLTQPAKKKAYKEGGSYDFLVSSRGKSYLIRPSYNYICGQLDEIHADILFLGIGGLSKDSKGRHAAFFSETVDKVKPETVIPIHWDNFFTPLYDGVKKMPRLAEDTDRSLSITKEYCESHNTEFRLLEPLETIEI